ENLALDASASVAGPTAVFEWDLDGDGQFDDATGAQPTLTPAQLDPLGLADGPAGPLILSVRVTEGPAVDTAGATLTLPNRAPAGPAGLGRRPGRSADPVGAGDRGPDGGHGRRHVHHRQRGPGGHGGHPRRDRGGAGGPGDRRGGV